MTWNICAKIWGGSGPNILNGGRLFLPGKIPLLEKCFYKIFLMCADRGNLTIYCRYDQLIQKNTLLTGEGSVSEDVSGDGEGYRGLLIRRGVMKSY